MRSVKYESDHEDPQIAKETDDPKGGQPHIFSEKPLLKRFYT